MATLLLRGKCPGMTALMLPRVGLSLPVLVLRRCCVGRSPPRPVSEPHYSSLPHLLNSVAIPPTFSCPDILGHGMLPLFHLAD
ncbi:hypothetical protein NL676_003710 [Syzygium grande]|nr:hypothetical protein NL676_003710 [Syzygium grande]